MRDPSKTLMEGPYRIYGKIESMHLLLTEWVRGVDIHIFINWRGFSWNWVFRDVLFIGGRGNLSLWWVAGSFPVGNKLVLGSWWVDSGTTVWMVFFVFYLFILLYWWFVYDRYFVNDLFIWQNVAFIYSVIIYLCSIIFSSIPFFNGLSHNKLVLYFVTISFFYSPSILLLFPDSLCVLLSFFSIILYPTLSSSILLSIFLLISNSFLYFFAKICL